MNILNQFLESHSKKFGAATVGEDHKINFGYSNIKIVKVLDAAKGCFIVCYDRLTSYGEIGFNAELWTSNRVKRCKTFRYSNEQSRLKNVRRMIEIEQRHAVRIAEASASRKAQVRGLEVGDMLSAVWGYDQTNYNYYQVTKLVGNKMVEVREVAQMIESTEYMQGNCVPVSGDYIGEPKKRVANNGGVKINSSIHASIMEYTEVAGTRIYSAGHFTSYH
tara:strand:- start:1703 stop:2362 length:660 start_codon:yes stop_codon:yes gene_type:complete